MRGGYSLVLLNLEAVLARNYHSSLCVANVVNLNVSKDHSNVSPKPRTWGVISFGLLH